MCAATMAPKQAMRQALGLHQAVLEHLLSACLSPFIWSCLSGWQLHACQTPAVHLIV